MSWLEYMAGCMVVLLLGFLTFLIVGSAVNYAEHKAKGEVEVCTDYGMCYTKVGETLVPYKCCVESHWEKGKP